MLACAGSKLRTGCCVPQLQCLDPPNPVPVDFIWHPHHTNRLLLLLCRTLCLLLRLLLGPSRSSSSCTGTNRPEAQLSLCLQLLGCRYVEQVPINAQDMAETAGQHTDQTAQQTRVNAHCKDPLHNQLLCMLLSAGCWTREHAWASTCKNHQPCARCHQCLKPLLVPALLSQPSPGSQLKAAAACATANVQHSCLTPNCILQLCAVLDTHRRTARRKRCTLHA